jgi:hypothetical protein
MAKVSLVIPVDLGGVTAGKDQDHLVKENDVTYVSENKIRRFLFDVKNLTPGGLSMGATAF